ncbi:MAG: hypothetical protein U0T33_06050, partial [Bacteroidales bacterium]
MRISIRQPVLILSLILLSCALTAQEFRVPPELFSRAELSGYTETSRDSDVAKFCRTIGKLGGYAHT